MDEFYTKMKLLRTTSLSRSSTNYKETVVTFRELANALFSRWNVVSAEKSLRDALGARNVDTHLSQGSLQQLKVRALSHCMPSAHDRLRSCHVWKILN